jgi:hypothetical protein
MPNATELLSTIRESAATARAAARALQRIIHETNRLIDRQPPPVASEAASLFRAATALQDGGKSPAQALAGPSAAVLSVALSGDFSRALQGVLRSAVGQLARGLVRQAGTPAAAGLGAIGGSILSNLVGGGLSLLLGRLFGGQAGAPAATQPVPLPSLVNFPQFALPGYASAPASPLLGQRAVPRSPGLSVTVEYKRGADDFVVAKVAQRLSELNSAEGVC